MVSMNKENLKRLKAFVDEHAPVIQHRLPPSPMHPNGRNAYAHLWILLKNAYSVEHVKYISDDQVDICLEILKLASEYAHEENVESRFPTVTKTVTLTLDDFFK